ncbi:TonB-dependent receptor [Sphingobium boeckii]|uniref:Iron complex outermembrane receptor protein n=1 Tax=Sphingobium boeckii TaxID=1082345 RepID=A0A7W9AFP2_9SPHN|nr:TonB-dependent receptor plug domain-containing protein [Sphingobium boeckii]MBB5684817.1 iron complex outermembrane receptor protein [Sphingobium boeckii]
MDYFRNGLGRRAIWATTMLSSMFTASLSYAQSAASPTTPNTVDPAVVDIIVTAQRRDESLSKTPVAVSVFNSETLAKNQIVSEQDLHIATPGLSVRSGLSSNNLNYAIRGQSRDVYSGTRPGVLPYFNDVQIGGAGGASLFYDLSSVQVLKGPQGTLFGRSATGGAVLFSTAKPTDELNGYASGLLGNYGARKIEGAINLPLAQNANGSALLARVAGFYDTRNGFQTNVFDPGSPRREGDHNRWGIRGSLTAQLGDRFRNELVVDYYKYDGSNTIPSISGLMPFTGVGAPFIPAELLYAGNATPQARATGIATAQGLMAAFGFPAAAIAAQPAFYDAYFANPQHPAGGLRSFLAEQLARGPFVVAVRGQNIYNAKNTIISNSSIFDLSDEVQIKNIFGYTKLLSESAFDAGGNPFGVIFTAAPGSDTRFIDNTKQISDEFQLLGSAFSDRLSYVTGLYYSHEKRDTLNNATLFDILAGGIPISAAYSTINKTYAAYGQATLKLNDDGLALTLGARYTNEKVKADFFNPDGSAIAAPAPAGLNYSPSTKYNKLSWQIGVQDQVSSNLLLYIVSRRAYKSGGYNGQVGAQTGTAVVGGNEFGAEQLTDVEVGAKFSGRVGDMPARLNVALFNIWDKDSQRTAYAFIPPPGVGPTAVTVNVPSAKTYGFEVDGQIKLLRWLTIGGSFSYLHPRFTNGGVVVFGNPDVFNQVPDTPRKSGVFYADVEIPVKADLSILLHGDVYAQDNTFTSPTSANNFGTDIPGYALANFHVGLEDSKTGWSLTANLKNAFNRLYYTGGVNAGQIFQANIRNPGDPRTFTVEARIKF